MGRTGFFFNAAFFDSAELGFSIFNGAEAKNKNCDACGCGSFQYWPFFSGMDDFTVYNPRFETQLKLNHYIDGELDFSCSGSFWDAFIDENLLNDKNYYNKYNSLLHGSYVEAVIQNENSNNEYKALLVTHSYGRGLAQYLSLYFKELRYIDPQPGRFQGSICQYIEEYHPNVVIIMYNDLLNITN